MSKQITVLNTGDWHLSSEEAKYTKAVHSLDQIVSYVQDNPVDYIKIDGDLWDLPQRDPYYESKKEGRGVALARHYLPLLARMVRYVLIGKGNAHHDATQSISKLHQLWADNILAYEYPVVLGFENDKYYDLFRNQELLQTANPEIIIPLMPYPNKSMLMEYHKSIDESNKEFGEIFDGLMTAFGVINSKFKCPKVLGFHGNVQGARLSNGQSLLGQDIIISPHSLLKAKCDFYNLAHIHLPQWIIENVMGYCSSIYNKDWGETEQKYFTITRFDVKDDGEYKMEVERVPIAGVKPMVDVKAEWKDGQLIYDKPEGDCEVRVKFDIPESEQELLTTDKLEQLKKDLGGDVKIVKNTIPNQRLSRSEKIMSVTTDEEEVEEWVNVMLDEPSREYFPKEEVEVDGQKIIRRKLPKTMIEKISQIRDSVNKGEEVSIEEEF